MIRKREKQIKFRVTEEELKLIKSKIEDSKLKQTEFFISCATNKEIVIIGGLKELAFEVNKIGNNLNQLTKIANREKEIDQIELKKAREELSEVWQLLRQLIQNQV